MVIIEPNTESQGMLRRQSGPGPGAYGIQRSADEEQGRVASP